MNDQPTLTATVRRRRLLVLLSMLAAALVAMLLYQRALGFAFFNDDPTGHFAWMESRSFLDFFTSSAEYGYYRPVVFVVLKGLVTAVGYAAPVHHALLLVLHGANAALLWLLAYRLSKSWVYAGATAVLFATVPFNYEAVIYVASLTHPLLLFWTLAALLLYRAARKRGARWLHAPAYLALILGQLTHENGLFIPLALVGLEWVLHPPRGWLDGVKRPFLPYFIAPALYLLLWFSIPKGGEQALPTLASAARNLLPFLQTLVYPLLPALRLDAGSGAALVALCIATVLGLLALARVARAVRLWAFGLGWWALSALPAVLALSTDYLYGSPRLSYLPSVGVALLWALPVLALARFANGPTWRRTAVALAQLAFIALVALPPLRFIRCELDFYAQTSAIVGEMSALVADAPAERVQFVNVPFFFSSYAAHPDGCPNPYAWTPVGAVVVPTYAQVNDFVRFNGGPDRGATAVTVPDYAPGWATVGEAVPLAELRSVVEGTAVYVFDLTRGFFDLSAAWLPGAAEDIGAEPLATFGAGLHLVERAVTLDNNSLDAVLTWRATAVPETPITAFVHVYDGTGTLVAQSDAPPAQGYLPLPLWQPSDLVRDRHRIQLDAGLPAGRYTIAAGLYNPLDSVRLPASSSGTPLANDIFPVGEFTK